jgi:hypothetical protein
LGVIGAGITVLMYNRLRSGAANRREEAVRRLVTIAATAAALLSGPMAAQLLISSFIYLRIYTFYSLVRHHVEHSPARGSLRGREQRRRAGGGSDGSTTAGDGGMVRTDPSAGAGVRSNLDRGKDRDREGRDCK